jgi:ABC-type sugar transport system ATPase subunit
MASVSVRSMTKNAAGLRGQRETSHRESCRLSDRRDREEKVEEACRSFLGDTDMSTSAEQTSPPREKTPVPRSGIAVIVRGISKTYGHTQALRRVTLELEPGTVHALVGENGAGKSTLGKIIAGVVSPDSGELLVDGQVRSFRAPRDALGDGITIIDQEFALLWSHSVLDNVFLGQDRKSRSVRLQEFRALQSRVGFDLDPGEKAGRLRVAEQQQVEILRAVSRGSRMIVMDEPTAALSRPEIASLLRLVTSLARDGVAIVYVSHALEEVLSIADVVTVLRDGELVWTRSAAEQTKATLVSAMLGRSLDAAFPPRTRPSGSAVRLSVRGLARPGVLHDISFELREGEIVGLAGLVGSGRSELAHALFGADPSTGEILLDGKAFSPSSPTAALRAGVSLLPESRKEQGLMLQNSVAYNVTVPILGKFSVAGLIRRGRKRQAVDATIQDLDIRPRDPRQRVGSLSGGNQQKTLFGRCLANQPRVLIVDEPTRGVDVGAKRAIYDLLTTLARSGCAVLLISSELEEIRGLAHRILVISSGRLVTELDADVSEERLLQAMFDNSSGASIGADGGRKRV